ncbi:hypothetical protein NPX79_00325 [Spiroplasma endosymbiont of Anurida maritima]|uniref:hypothetical protein n=1 Tax=Spiroplasma endosymbiont of Anurida maritima TaxID=2967972 RepID=UPI0036D2D314
MAKNNLNVSLIINDVEKDPDEVLQKHGKKALIDITNRKFSFLNFIIFKYSENNKFLQNKSTEVSNLVFEYLVNLQDEIEIESTIIELSSKINIDKKIIKNSYEIFKKNYSQKKKPKTLTFERLNSTSHDFFTQDTISYNHNFDEPKFLDNDVETIDAHLDDKFLDDFVSEMTNSSVNSSNNFFTEEFEKRKSKNC